MKRFATFAAALVLLLAAPSPARADALEWTMAPCVEPSFMEFDYDSGARLLVLNGSATQCGPVVEHGGFALATYYPGEERGRAPGWNLRRFAQPVEGTYRVFGAAVLPRTAGEYPVCMLAGAAERIQCILVTVVMPPTGYPRATFTPMPVDDPRVDRDVNVGTYTGAVSPPRNGGPVGICGTCF